MRVGMTDVPVQLRRILSRRDVLAIAFGAMVGWGWVVLAGEMIQRAGALGSILAFGAGAVMVWLVGLTDAGSLATVVAYLLVAVSFLVIRRRHPGLHRPYRTPAPTLVGWLAVATTSFFILLYMPGSPSSLVWPQEWAIVLLWVVVGAAFAFGMRRRVAALGQARQARLILGDYVKPLGL